MTAPSVGWVYVGSAWVWSLDFPRTDQLENRCLARAIVRSWHLGLLAAGPSKVAILPSARASVMTEWMHHAHEHEPKYAIQIMTWSWVRKAVLCKRRSSLSQHLLHLSAMHQAPHLDCSKMLCKIAWHM